MSCLWGRFGTLINGSAGEQQDAWKAFAIWTGAVAKWRPKERY